MTSFLPRDFHGAWVKKEGTKQYGKICYRFCPVHYNHSVPVTAIEVNLTTREERRVETSMYRNCDCEPMFWVMWYDEGTKFTRPVSAERAGDLRLLPVEFEPWYK